MTFRHAAFFAAALSLSTLAAASSQSAREVTWCGGTEPFWDLKLGPNQIQFKLVGDETMTIASRPARSANGFTSDFIALYQGRLLENDSRFMNVIISRGECSDGMSETEYPFEVMVLSGTNLYRGCCL